MRHLLLVSLYLLACGGFSAAAADWQIGPGYRSIPLAVPAAGKTGFTRIEAKQSGVTFTNVLSQGRSLTNQIYLNGSGVALGDVDGDGFCDIYLCGLDNPNALYRNRGQFRFEDISSSAGVACADQASTGAVLADIDGDRDLDLFVGGILRGVRLFLNDGKGRFRETTAEAGLTSRFGSTSIALADIDDDGLLDLYVVNYRSRTLRDEPDTRFRVSTANGQFRLLTVDNQPVTSPELQGRFSVDPVTGILENGEPDILYRNRGKGKFTAVAWTDGSFRNEEGQPISVPYDWGLSAMFHDINGDGTPDLYVCNDFHSEDRIWINDGQGRFQALSNRSIRHTSLFSMGVDFADIDGDGRDDIFVADMLSRSHARRQVQVSDRKMMAPPPGLSMDRPQVGRNTLFWNRGDDTFAEIAQMSGVEAGDWCWCPAFMDVDLDGYQDLLLVTGHERDAQNIDLSRQIEAAIKQRPMSRVAQMQLRKIFPVYDSPNFAFRNRGDLSFEEIGHAWGFDSTQVSQGIALGDLDNDGDQDIVINCLNDSPLIYRHESAAPRIAVRLRGKAPNVQGIGARIAVTGANLPAQSREVTSGGRYLSGDDSLATFAAATASNRLRIDVTWRDGSQSAVEGAMANQLFEIHQSNSVRSAKSPTSAKPTWFADLSPTVGHRHTETGWDDFTHQPLLPRRWSQGGPGITWFDVDGDGWEDLIIGSGRGGQLGVFTNNARGGFTPLAQPPFNITVTRDQTTVLGDRSGPGGAELLAGSANYEDGLTNGPVFRRYQIAARTIQDGQPGQRSSTGPLALGPPSDGKGMPLFVGGQVIRGRFPESASSLLFRRTGSEWQADPVANRSLAGVGLINSAVWSDLENDGTAELLLACEWGPVRVFRQEQAGLKDITRELGLDRFIGWWQSINTGDFDGDGKLDIVAGNWGRNSKYQSFLAGGLSLFAGDLNGDGSVELLEAYLDPDQNKVVPWRDWESLARTMPFIREQYNSFTQFSTATVTEILGPRQKQMQLWTVNTLDSMIFLNRNGRFEGSPMPIQAQLSPVFGIAVADFNADGNEDLFLAQNFFAVPPETSRYDAGLGVMLKGAGDGTFQFLPSAESGIRIHGEGRGAAVCDFDHDGRADLAIGQNAGTTLIYRNKQEKSGIRTQLRGPVGNPDGIGAQMRLEYPGGRLGPVREVHGGGGYWSQDAAAQVMGKREEPVAIRVLWPAALPQRVAVASGAREITITFPRAE